MWTVYAGSMAAKDGDTVAVHYTGKLDNGQVFDSSRERDPLEFRVGEGQVINGFDEAVRGLGVGESRTVRIEPENAYGPKREDLLIELKKDLFQGNPVQPGQAVELQDEAGRTFRAGVVDVGEEAVKVDLNHPLAGEALTFDIEVVDIKNP